MSHSRTPRSLLTGAAVLAAVAATAPAASAAGCRDAAAEPGSVSSARAEAAVQCLVNAERTERGLVPLRLNAKLDRTAGAFSRSLVRKRFFAHQSPSGSTPTSRIRRTGYLTGARRWTVGENLAWGESTLGSPEALVKAWMNSPPHRANVLNRRYREIGVGISSGTPTTGSRRSAGGFAGSTLSASFGLAVRSR